MMTMARACTSYVDAISHFFSFALFTSLSSYPYLCIYLFVGIHWTTFFFFLIGTVFLHSLSLIKALHNGRLIWVGPRGLQTVAVVNCDGLTVAHKSQTFLWALKIDVHRFLNARPLSYIFCNLIIN